MSIYQILDRFIFGITRFRKRRMQEFAKVMRPADSARILDVGGTLQNWQLLAAKPRVTLLNRDLVLDRNDYPENIKFEAGDALDMPYSDGEYDIVYSNSVIEHVSTWENQQRFAEEVLRIGTRIWVQTPAYEFFMEPHYLTPLIHWLPQHWRRRLVRNFTIWGWLTRPAAADVERYIREIRLVTFQEMQTLFPDCEIYVERWLGMPKSYIAVRAAPSEARNIPELSAVS